MCFEVRQRGQCIDVTDQAPSCRTRSLATRLHDLRARRLCTKHYNDLKRVCALADLVLLQRRVWVPAVPTPRDMCVVGGLRDGGAPAPSSTRTDGTALILRATCLQLH